MNEQITVLEFSLKEIYEQIGYTFKSDLLCIAAFINPSCKENKFRDKDDENKVYQVKNRNDILANYGDIAIYGAIGKLISDYTCTKGNNTENEYTFKSKKGELTTIKNILSENETFEKVIIQKGYDKFLIKGNNKKDKRTYADIFEGLVGAVAIDSNWNYHNILKVYKRLIGNYKEYIPQKPSKKENKLKAEKNKKVEEKNADYYILLLKDISKEKCLEKINQLVNKSKIFSPKIKERQNKNKEWIIEYSIKNIGTGKSSGKKKRESKRAACYNMITNFLKKHKNK